MSQFFPEKEHFPIAIKTLQYLEPVLQEELTELGIQVDSPGKRIVYVKGDMQTVYRCNIELRTALRVLVPITRFKANSPDELYAACMKYAWDGIMSVDQTIAIDTNVFSSQYKLPHFAALRMKDAVADYFKKKQGKRPDVDTENPDVRFNLHIDDTMVTISLDSSGESLNRRGYRKAGGGAPLNEVLAAGMLRIANIREAENLYFPMGGSGTLAIEAAYMLQNKPALWNRDSFGFMRWKSFDVKKWEAVLDACMTRFTKIRTSLHCSDADRKALSIAASNIREAGFSSVIDLQQKDFFELKPTETSGKLVINPPYGERMAPEQIDFMYKRMGDHLKHEWSGHEAWIISSNMQALKSFGLRPTRKVTLMNGPLECRFLQFELFRGERSKHLQNQSGG